MKQLPATQRDVTLQQLKFIKLYLEHGNAERAYRECYSVANRSDDAVGIAARRLMAQPHVKRELEAQRSNLGEKLVFDIEQVMKEWFDIATADPNDLISVEIQCCRHCYGINHQYQWKDSQEWAAALAEVMAENTKRKEPLPLPSAEGGVGFNFTKPVVQDCPKCFGRGNPTVVLRDTTKLTGKARKLYAGVKQTKDGVQILMRDQDAALANMAKAMGMFVEIVRLRADVRAAGANVIPDDPQEAARMYQELMKGAER